MTKFSECKQERKKQDIRIEQRQKVIKHYTKQYKKEYAEKLKKDFMNDRTMTASKWIAELGLGRSCFYDWQTYYMDFKLAVDFAKTYQEAQWLDYGLENIENPDFNFRMYLFQMTQRFGASKTRKIQASSLFYDNPNATLPERIEQAANRFANGEMTFDELLSLLDILQKAQTITERSEIVEKIERLEKMLEQVQKEDSEEQAFN